MNITIPFQQFRPSQQCVDWCVEKATTEWHNLEVSGVFIAVIAYLCLTFAIGFFLIPSTWLQNEKEGQAFISILAVIAAWLILTIFFVWYYFLAP